jgi:hypothetical protein
LREFFIPLESAFCEVASKLPGYFGDIFYLADPKTHFILNHQDFSDYFHGQKLGWSLKKMDSNKQILSFGIGSKKTNKSYIGICS